MTSLIVDRAVGAAGRISRRWAEVNPEMWMLAVELARVSGLSLLELIDGSYRELRDNIARAAFDRQVTDRDEAARWRREWALFAGIVLPIEAISTCGRAALDRGDQKRISRLGPSTAESFICAASFSGVTESRAL